jgi:hypothetical protein
MFVLIMADSLLACWTLLLPVAYSRLFLCASETNVTSIFSMQHQNRKLLPFAVVIACCIIAEGLFVFANSNPAIPTFLFCFLVDARLKQFKRSILSGPQLPCQADFESFFYFHLR